MLPNKRQLPHALTLTQYNNAPNRSPEPVWSICKTMCVRKFSNRFLRGQWFSYLLSIFYGKIVETQPETCSWHVLAVIEISTYYSGVKNYLSILGNKKAFFSNLKTKNIGTRSESLILSEWSKQVSSGWQINFKSLILEWLVRAFKLGYSRLVALIFF